MLRSGEKGRCPIVPAGSPPGSPPLFFHPAAPKEHNLKTGVNSWGRSGPRVPGLDRGWGSPRWSAATRRSTDLRAACLPCAPGSVTWEYRTPWLSAHPASISPSGKSTLVFPRGTTHPYSVPVTWPGFSSEHVIETRAIRSF